MSRRKIASQNGFFYKLSITEKTLKRIDKTPGSADILKARVKCIL
jgi:ribosomal protein L28